MAEISKVKMKSEYVITALSQHVRVLLRENEIVLKTYTAHRLLYLRGKEKYTYPRVLYISEIYDCILENIILLYY